MRIHPLIAVTNETSVLSDAAVSDICHALWYQALYHFAPNWGASATVMRFPVATPIPVDAWRLHFLDDSDQAGALGYHDFTPEGLPLGKVFAKTDLDYGYLPSVTASHEVLEMLADPDISRCYQTGNARFHALEVGDPVEADADGYDVAVGVGHLRVSNFILPSWFGQTSSPPVGERYDRQGLLTAPLTLRRSGYESFWTPAHGWQQLNAQGLPRAVGADDSPRFRDRSKTAGGGV